MPNTTLKLIRETLYKFFFIAIGSSVALLSSCTAAHLETDVTIASEVTSDVLGYKADIQELATRIKSEHPRPFRYISESKFDKLVSARIDGMTSKTTKRDFIWAFSEVLSSIRCGHSRLPYFNQENALITDSERIPLDVRIVDNRLFVLDPLTNRDTLSKGDEIATINGNKVSDLRDEIFKHIPSEGVDSNFRIHALNYYANPYLTYALDFPSEYQITLIGDETTIKLHPIKEFNFKPLFHPNDPCQERLCYRVDQDTNAGIMTIHTFAYYGDQGQVFSDYVDASFADITENNRAALVIDIRFHDGGSGNAGAYILRRLAKDPFAYFDEISDKRASSDLSELQKLVDVGLALPIYLIVDGDTVSSAPHFAAIFKENQMGTIIGEAMGGNKSTNDGKKTYRSTNHDVEYTIARMRFDVSAPNQSVDEAVQPDIALSYTVEDVLNGEDSMLEYVLDIVSKQ